MTRITWARRFATGLLGRARALFHGLGPKGEHPSRKSENPFHSRWYRAAAIFQPLYRLLGFTLCISRCSWSKDGWRLSLAWVGWSE